MHLTDRRIAANILAYAERFNELGYDHHDAYQMALAFHAGRCGGEPRLIRALDDLVNEFIAWKRRVRSEELA